MGFDLPFRFSDLEIWVSFDSGLVFICSGVFVLGIAFVAEGSR